MPVIGTAPWLVCEWRVFVYASVCRHGDRRWFSHGMPVIGIAPWLACEWQVLMFACVCRHSVRECFYHGVPVIGIALFFCMPVLVGTVLADGLAVGWQ